MSAKIMGRVWDLDLPHNELLVLLAMADHADHEGQNIFPSLGLIAWKTGYSSRQVMTIIKGLILRGLLKLDMAQPGKRKVYSIDFSQGQLKTARKMGKGGRPKNTHEEISPLKFFQNTPEVSSLEVVVNRHIIKDLKDSVTGVETPVTAAVETEPTIPATPDLSIGLSNPPPAAAPPPPKPRKVNPVFDAVAQYGFGIQPGQEINGAGGRIGKIVGWLKTSAPDTTPADLIRFYGWYQREYPGISAPRDVTKFGEHFTVWQQTAEAKIPNVGKIEGQQSLQERIAAAKARPVTLAWNSASDNSMEEI